MTANESPKQKALDLAGKTDRKTIWKRFDHAIGRCAHRTCRIDFYRLVGARFGAWRRAVCRAAVSSKSTVLNRPAKRTLATHIIAEAQKAGGTCAFIDAEHAFDATYAGQLGVDVDNLLVSQPDAGEQALNICDMLVRSGALDVVVIDSVAALVPQSELEGDMGDSSMGLHARLMSQAMRKLTGTINRTKTVLIFINQIREKIGVMFGNPETTTGGRALKFYSSVRMDIRRIGAIKEGSDVVGNRYAGEGS